MENSIKSIGMANTNIKIRYGTKNTPEKEVSIHY